MKWLSTLLVLASAFAFGEITIESQSLIHPYTAAIRIATLDDYPQYRAEDGAYILGYEDAPVRIVYFEDPLCPHCWDYKPVMDTIIERYVLSGQVQIESRYVSTQEYSATLAGVLQCAASLTPYSYWGAKDQLYDIVPEAEITDSLILQTIPAEFGLELLELTECIPAARQHLTDVQLFRQYGLSGVPSVLVFDGDNPTPESLSSTNPSLEELEGVIQAITGADI